jgi:hypothetical protein
VLVFISMNGNSTTVVDNNGATPFTEIGYIANTGGGGHNGSVWYRWWQSGDPATYTFTESDNQRWGMVAMAIENAHSTTPFDAALVESGTTDGGTSCDAPSITTVNANSLHITSMHLDGNTVTIGGFPASYTVHESGANQNVSVVSLLYASAGATGTQNFNTFSEAQACVSFSLAIRSEDAAGSTFPFGIINSVIVN